MFPVTRSQTQRRTATDAAANDEATVAVMQEPPTDVMQWQQDVTVTAPQVERPGVRVSTNDVGGERGAERPRRQVTWATTLENVRVLPAVERVADRAVPAARADDAVVDTDQRTSKTRHPRGRRRSAEPSRNRQQCASSSSSEERRRPETTAKKPLKMTGKRRLEPARPDSEKRPRKASNEGEASTVTVTQSTRASSTSTRTMPGGAVNDAENEELVPDAETTLQVTDDELIAAQVHSKMTQKLLLSGEYQGQKMERVHGLVVIHTAKGRRVLLPPSLWAIVLKELHGSVWGGHLKETHTYARVVQVYWWPGLRRAVRRWVRGCQECGSRKARPRQVVPPLRSIRGGDVGDRWALDVAGPFPVASGGERYVIAAVEYVTRYAVATSVTEHTAEAVARFLMHEVVLRFGVFRELLTDGAPEMTGHVIELLVEMLQARQTNPVPYRPQFIGLVERFNRTWKDCVATMMQDEQQRDWELFVRFAVYAYNSAQHTTVALSPNELMLGRKLRTPNDLLRRTELSEAGDLVQYQEQLLKTMDRSRECAEKARVKEQRRQAKYYDRKGRQDRVFRPGDRVWLLNPPRGPKATKFVHQWMGPLKVVEPAGYDNFLLQREDKTGEPELMIAHVSFMLSYHFPAPLLEQAANDIIEQLDDEEQGGSTALGETTRAAIRATTARSATTPTRSVGAGDSGAVRGQEQQNETDVPVVELRRRRRRNRAGQYVLEYELRRADGRRWYVAGKWQDTRWVGVAEYDRWFDGDRVVETPVDGEVV